VPHSPPFPPSSTPGVGVAPVAVGVGLGLVLVVPEAAGVETEGLAEDGDTEVVGVELRVGVDVTRGERDGETAGGRTDAVDPPGAVVRVLGEGLVLRLLAVGTGEGDVPGAFGPGSGGRSWLTAVPMSTTSTSSTSATSGNETLRPPRRATPPVPGRFSGAVGGRW